jgi:hypothetical protein
VLLDIDHSELADASLSPHSPASKLLDASASPLNAVFEALPVLAHRVYAPTTFPQYVFVTL